MKFNNSGSVHTSRRVSYVFHWVDYLVFILSLVLMLFVGLVLMFAKRHLATTDDFFLGQRSLNFFAVALSLLASLLNGIFVIGLPAEVHYYGTAASYSAVGFLIGTIFTAHVILPKFHTFQFTVAYQYIEQRFNAVTRLLCSIVFCLSVILFLSVVLYVPALAFAQVTAVSKYITIILTGLICTAYTGIGGIRAVVWTDTLQMIILLIGLVVIAILGCIRVGGLSYVWTVASETGRFTWDRFGPDPRERHTFWNLSFGGAATSIGVFLANQMMVQRFLSIRDLRKVQLALYVSYATFVIMLILIVFIGLTLHAYFYNCDPLETDRIESGDQIFPLFIMELLGGFHGVPGLITASVFAAALSSVSSVINSMSAVCLEDFVDPALRYFSKTPLKDAVRRRLAIIMVACFGILTVGLSYVAEYFTTKIIQMSLTIWGSIGGPLAGVFIMGLFIPWCNSKGAISGLVGSLLITLWISIGNILYAPAVSTLPVGNCVNDSFITLPRNITRYETIFMPLYRISYTLYGLIGIVCCVLIGLAVSLMTGGLSKKHLRDVHPSLLFRYSGGNSILPESNGLQNCKN